MANAMAHKGADGTAQWNDGVAALAHATLHTTAQSRTAPQPFVNSNSGCVIVMDGFLTNNEELRLDLLQRKVQLRNESDAELILAAYEVWGQKCAAKCDGEFAFVLWDAANKTALCARDHQGLRPLVYSKTDDRIVIASDLATLNAGLGQRSQPNLDYLAQMAAGQFYSSTQTAAKDAFRCMPAHVYEFSRGSYSKHRYWSLPTDLTIRYRKDEDYIEHYKHVLTDCVRRSSRTDCPLALEVSGGLDSSATYCLAHELLSNGELLAPSAGGYSLRGAPGSISDEIRFARSAAEYANGTLREVPLFEPQIEWFVEQAAIEQDFPTYTNAAMSLALEQAMVADGCRVTIGGTGGDQWLDGSLDYYIQHLRAGEIGQFFRSAARDVTAFGARFALPFAFRQIPAAFLPAALTNRLRRYNHGAMQGRGVGPQWLSEASRQSLRQGFEKSARRYTGDFIADRKRARLERPEAQLVFDLMARQYSRLHLESRSPMFARAFIEFSAATPEHIRYRGGQTKWVHRQAMQGIVPEDILDRESKASFPAPFLLEQARKYCEQAVDRLTDQICSPSGLAELLTDSDDVRFDLARPVYLWGVFAVAATLVDCTDIAHCEGTNYDEWNPKAGPKSRL